MKATDIKTGMAVRIDDHLYIVTQYTHVTPGNLRSFVQVKIRSVFTGQTLEKRLRSSEEVERILLDRREAEYLYSDDTGAVFMDSESFDQFTIPQDVLGDSLLYIRPNTTLTGLVSEGKVICVELPNTVELTVMQTTPGIKGSTATNQLKEAVAETGLKIRVPPFIEIGEVVRINTEDGSYLGRVTG